DGAFAAGAVGLAVPVGGAALAGGGVVDARVGGAGVGRAGGALPGSSFCSSSGGGAATRVGTLSARPVTAAFGGCTPALGCVALPPAPPPRSRPLPPVSHRGRLRLRRLRRRRLLFLGPVHARRLARRLRRQVLRPLRRQLRRLVDPIDDVDRLARVDVEQRDA